MWIAQEKTKKGAYLELIQPNDTQKAKRITLLPIHLDTTPHAVLLASLKDYLRDLMEVEQLRVRVEEGAKESFESDEVDVEGRREEVELDVDQGRS